MVPTSQDSPRVHDLLLLRSGMVGTESVAKPAWATPSSASNFWVVVRRTTASNGFVAAGIRGSNRQQRWASFVDLADVRERVCPSQLSFQMARRTRCTMPALSALSWLEGQLDKSKLDWGPVGSVGFELATGQQVVTETSDLDIALFAPAQFSRDTARDLWSVMKAASARIDVLVETPYCGFSLEEYAREGTEKVLIRLPESRRLATNPWDISVIGDKT